MTVPKDRGYLSLPWKLNALSICKKSGSPIMAFQQRRRLAAAWVSSLVL